MSETAPTVTEPLPLEHQPEDYHRQPLDLLPGVPVLPQVRDEVERHGGNLTGLRIGDDKSLYEVIDTEGQIGVAPAKVKTKVGLPRFVIDDEERTKFTGQKVGGKRRFRRPEVETVIKKKGLLPRLVRRGSVYSLERQEKKAGPGTIKGTPVVTAVSYDPKTHEVLSVEEFRRSEFYAVIDGMSQERVNASWAHSSDDTTEMYAPKIRRNNNGEPRDPFEEISRQLEGRGISSWKGLAWRRYAKDKGGRWSPSGITQEVVWDGAIKKRDNISGPGSPDYKWIRTFALKTTHNGQPLSLELMSDLQFAEYLRKVNAGADKLPPEEGARNQPLGDMFIVIDKQPIEKLSNEDRIAYLYRRMGGAAVSGSPYESLEHDLKSYIKSQTDRPNSPETFSERGEAERIALWLLDYGDIRQRPEDREDDVVALLGNNPPFTRHQNLVKLTKAIERHGLLALYDTARQIRSTYLETMKKLGVPTSILEQSLSNVFGVLADDLSKNDDLDKVRTAQNRLINRLVGQSATKIVSDEEDKAAYEAALFRIKHSIVPSGALGPLGQPEYAVHPHLEFNKQFLAASDSPAISPDQLKAWKAREKLRRPVYDQAEKLYKKLHEKLRTNGRSDEDADYFFDNEELEEFGQALRRLVGD